MSQSVRSSLVLLALALAACKERPDVSKDGTETPALPRALEDDSASGDVDEDEAEEALPLDTPSRCESTRPGVLLGGPGRGVLLGEAVALGPHRYVVPHLTGSTPERAALAFVTFEGAATSRTFDLGEVHGQVEPPLVVGSRSQEGRVFVAVVDSDATSSTLRTATVVLDSGVVAWGPTARAGRGESTGASLAASSSGLLLVWDRVEPALSRSAIFALTAPNASAETKHGEERRITARSMDVDAPRLVPVGDDFWLVAVRYEEAKDTLGAGQADALGLVEEPPRQLVVARTDRLGKLQSEFVVIERLERGELVFDVAALASGRLLVAHASDTSEEISLTTLGPDGVPATERVVVPPGSQGAPSLLVGAEVRLLAVGAGAGTYVGSIDAEGRLTGSLAFDRGLRGVQPLAARASALLVSRSRGNSLELAEFRCTWAPSAAAAGKSAR